MQWNKEKLYHYQMEIFINYREYGTYFSYKTLLFPNNGQRIAIYKQRWMQMKIFSSNSLYQILLRSYKQLME